MPYKILLVEDDDATRGGLTTLLKASGYDVLAVSTLPDALNAITDEAPDLLITDIRLDGYNGLQLIAAGPRQVPTMVITGFPDLALEAEARRFGADYFVKPISPRKLLDAVALKLSEGRGVMAPHLPARRWARRPLLTRLPVRIEHAPARILDISYGGACLELERPPGGWLPFRSKLTVPDVALSVQVAVVWKRRTGETSWLCGMAITDEHRSVWRGLVDAVS